VFENWTTGHALRKYVDTLDPVNKDEEIAAKVSNLLFADAYFAHAIYLVTFARQAAVPSIARVLYRSGNGDIATRPRQRNNDTIVYFTEFYRRGYRSEDGKAAIQRMEEIHSRFLIDQNLKIYTMATVMLEPDRLANQFGVDPFRDVDREGRWNFWRGIAREMGFELPADNRADFLAWMENYEAENYARTDDGMGCYEGLVEDWLRWYPSWLPMNEMLARQSLAGLLDDRLRDAMGVEPPPRWIQAQVDLVAKSYLHSTPVRVFRKNRSLVNFFGKQHAEPRDLAKVGHVPHSERARSGSRS
jgi:hypothetical protein